MRMPRGSFESIIAVFRSQNDPASGRAPTAFRRGLIKGSVAGEIIRNAHSYGRIPIGDDTSHPDVTISLLLVFKTKSRRHYEACLEYMG